MPELGDLGHRWPGGRGTRGRPPAAPPSRRPRTRARRRSPPRRGSSQLGGTRRRRRGRGLHVAARPAGRSRGRRRLPARPRRRRPPRGRGRRRRGRRLAAGPDSSSSGSSSRPGQGPRVVLEDRRPPRRPRRARLLGGGGRGPPRPRRTARPSSSGPAPAPSRSRSSSSAARRPAAGSSVLERLEPLPRRRSRRISSSSSIRDSLVGRRARGRRRGRRPARPPARAAAGAAFGTDAGASLQGLGFAAPAAAASSPFSRKISARARHCSAALRGLALLPVDVAQLLARVHVVGEARDHRLELVGGLVDEAVLAEDLALGQVLLDELLVLLAERARDLDGRPRRRRRGARRGDAGPRRGDGPRTLAAGAARELEVAPPRPTAGGAAGAGRRPRGRPPPPSLPRTNSQLGPVLLVLRLAADQDLEHARPPPSSWPCVDVGLGELRVGRSTSGAVLAELPVDLDQLGQALHVRRGSSATICWSSAAAALARPCAPPAAPPRAANCS